MEQDLTLRYILFVKFDIQSDKSDPGSHALYSKIIFIYIYIYIGCSV